MSIETDLREYIEELKKISYLYHIIKKLENILERNTNAN